MTLPSHTLTAQCGASRGCARADKQVPAASTPEDHAFNVLAKDKLNRDSSLHGHAHTTEESDR